MLSVLCKHAKVYVLNGSFAANTMGAAIAASIARLMSYLRAGSMTASSSVRNVGEASRM